VLYPRKNQQYSYAKADKKCSFANSVTFLPVIRFMNVNHLAACFFLALLWADKEETNHL